MKMILISAPILIFSIFIVDGNDHVKKHYDSPMEKYFQFTYNIAESTEKVDHHIRAKAQNELRNAVLPYTPTLIIKDFTNLRMLRPNITVGNYYVSVKKAGQCEMHRISGGIFTDYHECDLDVAHFMVDWARAIRCPHKNCKVSISLKCEMKQSQCLVAPELEGKKGWKLTDRFDTGMGAGTNADFEDLSVNEHCLRGGERRGPAKDNMAGRKYEFFLGQNETLVAVMAVAGVTCQRTPYEIFNVQLETKFDLFNINVSKCVHVENGTGCLTRCEHLIVNGVTPKGLGRHSHRLCWWDLYAEKIFIVRKKPLKLCDYDSKEQTIPLRDDGTVFSTHFWFEHS